MSACESLSAYVRSGENRNTALGDYFIVGYTLHVGARETGNTKHGRLEALALRIEYRLECSLAHDGRAFVIGLRQKA